MKSRQNSREAGEDRNYRGYEYFYKSVTVQYFHSYGQKEQERKDEKIGIIGAMELEVEELKSQMEEVCVKEKHPWNSIRVH